MSRHIDELLIKKKCISQYVRITDTVVDCNKKNTTIIVICRVYVYYSKYVSEHRKVKFAQSESEPEPEPESEALLALDSFPLAVFLLESSLSSSESRNARTTFVLSGFFFRRVSMSDSSSSDE